MTFKHGVIVTILTILTVGAILHSIENLEDRVNALEHDGEKI